MARILIAHGPNLNLLGSREQHIYGSTTLADINSDLEREASRLGHETEILQTNHEGVLVDWIHAHGPRADFLILNPAAFTHTSVALRDAILGVAVPVIEVHLSNIYRREPFRAHSYIADIAVGQVAGFGPHSYGLALQAAHHALNRENEAAPQS
ncbi:MAG: type II 3-dehydroquinate dehydratase [Candidatus Tectomicrobia bacterium]|nr:type II 3-dehydroquinate dehydratase [Candidatus Tectomicrobia bacterium]